MPIEAEKDCRLSAVSDPGTAEGPFRPVPAAANGDSLDWKDLSAKEIYRRVTEKVRPGSIVLFHNAALHTPEALEDIVKYLLAEGYTIVPISQLILTGEYTIDHTGRQFPASAS